jgi:hypothetical protein
MCRSLEQFHQNNMGLPVIGDQDSRKVIGQVPAIPSHRALLIDTTDSLAQLLAARGRLQEAEKAYSRLLESIAKKR